MTDDDSVATLVDRVLDRRLRQLQQVTGLPVVFAGAVSHTGGRQHLVISRLRGTVSDSLDRLEVARGRGLGGTAMARGVPCRVDDYASTAAITPDYRHAVGRERLTSVVAVPLRLRGRVGGILYGAVRDRRPIGDVALRRAEAFAGSVERELAALLPAAPPKRSAPSAGSRASAALAELAGIARTTPDPGLRRRLSRIVAELEGAADAPPPELSPAAGRFRPLSSREVEALQLVEVGMRNLQIAEVLGLSPETVKAYLRSAMRKLEVTNRTAAVHTARTRGLL